MKKVLNGRLYDTETSTLIAKCAPVSPFDLDSNWEELYRKTNNEFLLYNEREPYSKCDGLVDGKCVAEGDLQVLSADEARQWLEKTVKERKHYMVFFEKYEDIFKN